jgi:DNA-binding transcriptional LysR family regulator
MREERSSAQALFEPTLFRDITLAWREGRRQSPAAAEFLELARATFG